ncbi:MAG: NAD(P)H-hydrate dehydratase [Dehalococcoidia bacterium]
MKLVSVEQMQAAERECGVPLPQLMENAGLAVAQEGWLLLGEVAERRIVVLVGPGNNGGDGLVAARHLREWSGEVTAYLLTPRDESDEPYASAVKTGVAVAQAKEDAKSGYKRLDEMLGGADLVIDALLGTGRARPIEGAMADVLDRLRAARERSLPPKLLAVDLPTGVDADTGTVDPHCVAVDGTVTFAWSKPGLHVLPGSRYAGRVEVVDIGIPRSLESDGWTEVMTSRWASAPGGLPERPPDAHKGTFGRALVVAGSPRYTGAAYLACMGAIRVGAGLVTLGCASTVYPILASKLTETTFEPLPDEEGYLTAEASHAVGRLLGSERGYEALLFGPGLGQEPYVRAFVKSLLPSLKGEGLRGVVIDADGLNNLSQMEGWWREIGAPVIVTPHPGELSRLTGLSMEEIAADRLGVARKCAAEWGVTVVLKGANTVVASPGGARLSPFANPGLASAGTGDVLSGTIVGLLAQGVEPYEAASLGVYVHGLAGERVRADLGSAGMAASDLLMALPRAIKELRSGG